MSSLAVDTRAAVDYMRPDRNAPPQLALAETVFLPLQVLGELFAGAFSSTRRDENLRAIDELATKSTVLLPTIERAAGSARAGGGWAAGRRYRAAGSMQVVDPPARRERGVH